MNYHVDFKYVHVYNNIKGTKYPGVTLGIGEFLEAANIVSHMNMAGCFFQGKGIYIKIKTRTMNIKNITTENYRCCALYI